MSELEAIENEALSFVFNQTSITTAEVIKKKYGDRFEGIDPKEVVQELGLSQEETAALTWEVTAAITAECAGKCFPRMPYCRIESLTNTCLDQASPLSDQQLLRVFERLSSYMAIMLPLEEDSR